MTDYFKCMCIEMGERGIEDPSSQVGIDFCTNECPHESGCVAIDGNLGRIAAAKAQRAKILHLMLGGLSQAEAAVRLGVSLRTVRMRLGGDLRTGELLTITETKVLEYVVEGLENKEIAIAMKHSEQTTKNHLTAIMRKLGMTNRTQVAVFAVRAQLVESQSEEQHSESNAVPA